VKEIDWSKCDCGAGPSGVHSRECTLSKTALGTLGKKKSATPSETVTWKRIGAPRVCTRCGRKLKLDEVREFGTRYTDGSPEGYVHCDACLSG
jgi:hypothetical protein